jgi:peptidoglycan/LPS O-acetylase OafA/YrhL
MVTSDTLPAGEGLPMAGLDAGTAPEDRSFRPDVQGLRAVAVLVVVLFHVHLAGFGGGFVGVDVFFVISGFVITGLLLRERSSKGSTSILSFYARRARRIIPAATLVIVISVVASYVILGSLTGNGTAGDARWASVFLVNVHFAHVGTNYLAALGPPSVLQNFWSLAVEEQFYLVYPAIVLVIGAFSTRLSFRRRLALVLIAAVIASLIYSIVETPAHPATTYFSVVPRVWELALGGLVAVATTELQRLSAPIAAALSWLGLAMVLTAGAAFTASTEYPGWAVVIPAGGAALIIAGGAAVPAYGAEIVLGLRPVQWIGLISYSLYLWHWPVLTLAAEHSGTDTLPVADGMLWLLLSLVLAVAMYLLVENPLRHSKVLSAKRWLSLLVGVCLIVSGLVVSTAEIHFHKVTGLATPDLAHLSAGDPCPHPTKDEVSSLLGIGVTPSPKVRARLLVVGDSTACTMLPGLEAVGAPSGIRVEDAAVIGCGVVSDRIAPRFVDGADVNAVSRVCQNDADKMLASALKLGRPNVVLWSSAWERSALLVGSGKVLRQGSPQWYRVLMQRIEKRVRQFTALGATVVMVTQPPFAVVGHPSRPSAVDEDFVRLNSLLAKFARHRPHVVLANLSAYVCPSGPPCPFVVNRVYARPDGAHYSAEGSLWVARRLMPELGISALNRQTDPLPVMKMLRPANAEVIHGSYPLDGHGEPFQIGITKVEFEVTGGGLKDAVVGAGWYSNFGYVYFWNTTQVPNGTYVIRCTAYNAAGQRSNSKSVTVRVANKR